MYFIKKTPRRKYNIYDIPNMDTLEGQKLYRKLYNNDNRRKYMLKKKYGLSQESYEVLFNIQGNGCAICKTKIFGKIGPIVDHNHITGKVRGILCHNCNRALGAIKDNIDTAKYIIDYLSRLI